MPYKDKEKQKEHSREYSKKNREKQIAYSKEYYKKNRDKKIAYNKEYSKKNREKHIAYTREYYKKNRELIKFKNKLNSIHLTDIYILQQLRLSPKVCPKELIECKRLQILIFRETYRLM